jgi:hypothetical protein
VTDGAGYGFEMRSICGKKLVSLMNAYLPLILCRDWPTRAQARACFWIDLP